MDDSPRYELYGREVVIWWDYDDPQAYSRESLVTCIDYIAKTRQFYATKEAWLRQLSIFEGALAYLDKNTEEE